MKRGVLRTLAGFAFGGAVSTALAAGDPSIACFDAMAGNSSIAPLQGKVVLKVGAHPDLAMLSDDHHPTKRERDAINAWVAEGERCYDLGHDYRAAAYPPVVAALIDESMHTLEALVAKLYSGKLTYAQFNEQRQSGDDSYRERIAQAIQTFQADQSRDQANKQAQQASIEAQQRAAAAQESAVEEQREAAEQTREDERRALAVQMLSNMKPAYVAPPPPIHVPQTENTNCYMTGNQWHCTTIGN